MADNQQYSKFVIKSEADPISKGYSESSYKRDMNSIVKEVIKSLPKDTFLSVGEKQIAKSGRLSFDIYTHSEDSDRVRKILDEKLSTYHYKGSDYEKYSYYTPKDISIPSRIIESEKASGNKESEKTREKNHRGIIGNFLKVLGSLTILTDIARRILSTVMTNATESSRMALTAHNMGMSYRTVKEYEQIETKSGLELGTLSKAIADLQARFGNELSLDSEGLEYLGVLLGSELGDLLVSQLRGGANEDALATILNKVNEIVAEGKSPTGQYVGEAEARVKMYNYLLKMFPELASIFAKQQEQANNINSIYYKTFDATDFSSWKDALLKGTPQFSTAQDGLVQTLGEYKQVTDSLVKRLRDTITVTLAPSLIKLLSRIANLRFGLSETENRELNLANYNANANTIAEYRRRLDNLPATTEGMTAEQKLQYNAVKSVYEGYISKLEEENALLKKGKNVALIKPTEGLLQLEIGEKVAENVLASKLQQGIPTSLLKETAEKYYTPEQIEEAMLEVYGKSGKDIDKEVKARVEAQKAEIDSKQKDFLATFPKRKWTENKWSYERRRLKALDEAGFGKVIYVGNMNSPAFETDYSSIDEEAIRKQVEAEFSDETMLNNLTEAQKGEVYNALVYKSPLALQDVTVMDIEKQQREAEEANIYYTQGLVDINKINEKGRELIKAGAKASVEGAVTDSIGGLRSDIYVNFRDDRTGKIMYSQKIYSGSEQEIATGVLGTVEYTSEGNLKLLSASGTSASEVRGGR